MKRYTDFLKDNQFIRWQLAPDEELNAFWRSFRTGHPHLESELQKAIVYLRTTGLNKNSLSEDEQAHLLHDIQSAISRRKKIKRRRVVGYSIASCAAIALLVIGIAFFTSPGEVLYDPDQELIVGELLKSKDIQLITSEKSISFQDDVELVLNEAGTVKITQNNTEVGTVEAAKEQMNSLIIPYGKRSTLTLSDGSRVWLNSGSVFEFPAKFTDEERVIHLVSGEMYIEVAPDSEKPFYVHSSDFQVKVFGTAFNLSTYENTMPMVVLVEGSVALKTSAKTEETQLNPNELALYNSQSGTFTKRQVNADNYISWKEGYLTLEKTPMTEVLKQVERYYNLSFNFDYDVNLQKRTCTGKIYLSENLDNVMTTVTLLTSTRYEKENDRIYITNEQE